MGRMAATGPRFLTLADVAEVLNTSSAQVYALVRRGDLHGDQDRRPRPVAGRGDKLEEYIQRHVRRAQQDASSSRATRSPSEQTPGMPSEVDGPSSDRTSRPRSPSVISIVCSSPSRTSVNSTVSPGWWLRIATISAMPSVTRSPSTSVDPSPFSQPGVLGRGVRR